MRNIICYIALAFSISASAEVLLVENFDQPVGTPVTSCPGWTIPYGGTSCFSLTNGLTFDGYAGSDIGNAILLDAKSGNDQPQHDLAAVVTSDEVYAAFLLKPMLVNKDKDYFFSFGDNIAGSYNFNARVLISNTGQIGLTFADKQKAVFSNVALSPDLTYLIVVCYTIVPGNNNDQVSLYAFAQMPTEKPQTPVIGPLADAGKADINPSKVVLRGINNDDWIVLDGIRVATTWGEAVAPTVAQGLQSPATDGTKAYKRMENGQLIIVQGGKKYNALGAEIDY